MNLKRKKFNRRKTRHNRIRSKVKGTSGRPRLSVFRSNKHIFAQLIDDLNGVTLASASDLKTKKGTKKSAKKTEAAKKAGTDLAEAAKAKNIKAAVFDRGGYKYHGRIRAVAEGAREGGLKL